MASALIQEKYLQEGGLQFSHSIPGLTVTYFTRDMKPVDIFKMLQGTESAYKSSAFDYQDIRDDRVYTYFNMNENETLTYYIQLNAAYLGKYFLPGTYCSAMYDNTINAGVNGKWVEVVKE